MFKNNPMIYGVINDFWLSKNSARNPVCLHRSTSFIISSCSFDILLYAFDLLDVNHNRVSHYLFGSETLFIDVFLATTEMLLSDVKTNTNSVQQTQVKGKGGSFLEILREWMSVFSYRYNATGKCHSRRLLVECF